MRLLVVCVAVLALSSAAAAAAKPKSLPAEFPRCKLQDNECFAKAVEQAYVLLRKGIPSLGVPSIEPLRIPEIAFEQGTGSITIKMRMKNVEMHGFTHLSILSASDDAARGGSNIYVESLTPELFITADYDVDGRILLGAINGKGRGNCTIRDMRVSTTLENEMVTRDGQEYLKVNEYKVKSKVKSVNYEFADLFGADTVLGRQMNVFIKENSKELYEEMGPVLDEAFSQVYRDIANRIYMQVPFKDLFLD